MSLEVVRQALGNERFNKVYLPRSKVEDMRRIIIQEAIPQPKHIFGDYLTDPYAQRQFPTFTLYKEFRLLEMTNNFLGYFPAKDFEGSHMKYLYSRIGVIDITFVEFLEKSKLSEKNVSEEKYSTRILNETIKEFLQTIDDVITYYGITEEEILELKRTLDYSRKNMRTRRKVFKVYVHLRALGYGRNELVM